MRQPLTKKTECKWTEREEEDFSGLRKMLTEILCLAHFARGRDIIVTTDASRTGLAITLWQKQNNKTIRPIAFARRYSNDGG